MLAEASPLPFSISDAQRRLLDETLVLTVRKSFWASPESEVFPNRLFTRKIFWGPGRWGNQSRNPLNNLTVVLEGLAYARRRKPRLILIGSASRSASWFIRFKRLGWLPGTQLLATTQSFINDAQALWLDKIIVYSRGEIGLHAPDLQSKYVFFPLPADGEFARLKPARRGYIFSGGGAGRDFASLIEAVAGLEIPLRIVTFNPQTLGYSGPLPPNCQVAWKMPVQDFLLQMAGADFVVAPLAPGLHPHGHTTVVQALRLGKAVISTRSASVDDYVQDGRQGLLVEPGSPDGYRQAILTLVGSPDLLAACEREALSGAHRYTYAAFARQLVDLIQVLLEPRR